MEKEFLSKKYLEQYESSYLAKKLDLEDRQVQNWWIARRAKWNRTHDESQKIRKENEKRIYEPPENFVTENVRIKSEPVEGSKSLPSGIYVYHTN